MSSNPLRLDVIVVPTDFTDRCRLACDAAMALQKPGSVVHLVHVLAPLPLAHGWTQDYERQRRDSAQRALDEEAGRFEGSDVRTLLIDGGMGNPGDDIAEAATTLGATLIALPSHGRRGLARWAIGSVAERVVRLAHCPVLVLREALRTPVRHVLVPYDFSEPASQALSVASGLVTDPSGLHIAHVMGPMPPSTPAASRDKALDERRKGHVFASMREVMAARGVEDARPHVLLGPTGNPGSEICELAGELDVDLIVLPSHGRTGLARLLIGSVAERVVRLAHRPVLVLRS